MRSPKRYTEVTIGNKQFNSDSLDIDFLVEFDSDPEPNVAEVSLWNPSVDTISQVKKGTPVILNAGRDGDIGVLISGTVGNFEVIDGDVDTELKLYVGDGLNAWATVIKKSYNNAKASFIAKDLMTLAGLSGKIDLGKDITYTQVVFNGPLKGAVTKVAKDTNSKFYIKNGQGFIVKRDFKENSIFVLNKNSGLVGRPERVEVDEKPGYRVNCLLQHRINVGSYVRIESKRVNGDFRVVKGKHSEQTELEVLPI